MLYLFILLISYFNFYFVLDVVILHPVQLLHLSFLEMEAQMEVYAGRALIYLVKRDMHTQVLIKISFYSSVLTAIFVFNS